ncbi:piwi-like protein 1 [Panonychus citri]|uniref:piwi-like protein 1 n=1 Tax=Panonychus citri TaxID=50023 RepID=UPI002306F612|nr:piwi-like protein 1 [Panonychus citri]
MTGRARGPGTRARPRVLAPGQHFMTEEEAMAGESSSSSENGSGGGNGEALRGRGGLRSPQLITKPPNITTTIGTGGGDIPLLSNYFRIKVPDDERVFDYRVDFEPNVEAIFVRRRLINTLAEHFGHAYIFDGMSNLKSCVDIESPITYPVLNTTGEMINVTLRQTGDIGYGAFEMLRLYNTQMRRNLAHIGLHLIGRYFYDKQSCRDLEEHGGVSIFRGFLTAVNVHDGGILTVTDTIFKFIRKETLRETIMRFRDGGSPRWQIDAQKELAGTIVITHFNNKTYRISDIDYSRNPLWTFTKKDGSEVSIKDYYYQQYELEVRDMRQPLVVAVSMERDRMTGEYPPPVLLCPELCCLTGLTDRMRADHLFMRQVASSAKVNPAGRIAQLKQFCTSVNTNPRVIDEMGRWRMSMDQELVKVKGRVLSDEVLIMGNNTTSTIKNGEFSREMRGRTLYKPINFERWAMIFTARDEALATEFKNSMVRVGGPMGINFGNPRPFKIENDRAQSYLTVLKAIPTEAQLIVCLVPNNNKDRYDAIKRFLCIDHPIPSQVVTCRTLNRKGGMLSICTKIAIQVACKAGAEPWYLDIPPKKIMVIGFDTYHDSSVKGRSAGGFVCTMNSTLTKYYSRVVFHENREEMSANLGMHTAKALSVYAEANGGPPDRIIVYRDGVSEGMIPHIYATEVAMVRKGILRGNEGKKIPLTFIIVNKRINARFFAVKGDSFVNPPPGTIVDSTITREERYDFFLVSQSVTEGTVAPTMFDILCDESGWTPTNHQKLAYKLTHLYYNWAGTVKVPAPCQYAHKLAFLSGQSLHKEPNPKLTKWLFFL